MTGTRSWGPSASWGWAQLGLALVLLALMPWVDRLGWVLLVPTAGCALASGLRDLLLVPVLSADHEGIVLVDGVRRVAAGWDQVERIRTVRDRRVPLLEVDLGGTVHVLSARRLGAAVEDVRDELERVRWT